MNRLKTLIKPQNSPTPHSGAGMSGLREGGGRERVCERSEPRPIVCDRHLSTKVLKINPLAEYLALVREGTAGLAGIGRAVYLFLLAFGLPLSAFAVTVSATNFTSLIAILQNIVDYVIPFLIGLAVMFIVYGILLFISRAADEEKRTEAKNFILWSIVGLFVMVSIWGLVNILVGTFNLGNNTPTVVTNVYQPQVIPTAKLNTVLDLINQINAMGSRVIPFLIAIGFLILIFGIVNYIRQGDNEEKRAEGRMFVIWGIVSIFLMLSVWGLVNILVGTFNLNNAVTVNTIPPLPMLTP